MLISVPMARKSPGVEPSSRYLREIQRDLSSGQATEHTHRPALKGLIESLAPGVTATNEPKRVECGAPDFIISRQAAHGPTTLGYMEAKDVGKDLGEVERSDQLKRYLSALPNLILTDYLEFRWYVGGQRRGEPARFARVARGDKLAAEKGGAEAVVQMLTAFLSHQAEPINKPKELALRMARLTHLIRDMIVTAFEKESASATLRDLHGAFERALIPDLPVPQFADMFAQTLAYGLFAARVNHSGTRGSFKRLGAASEIPKTNPFLRQLFETITGTALAEEPYAGFVDDLAQLLADTDIGAVLADFGKRTARQDPVVHFYETFLAAYDPKLREARGVYYTPEPVVSYIVRSVDYLLKTRFGCPKGLADTATVEYEREIEEAGKLKKVKAASPRVLILDPACGTGTFLYAVIDLIRSEFMRQGNAGMWSGYVRNHLLPRIFGFELLMAPYAVAHFKLGMQLAGHDLTPAQREKWAYDFSGDERLGVYLTNTLEEAERRAETLFGPLRVITEEANAAAGIKRDLPILAVIGNPPYSGHSANRSWEMLPDAKTKRLKKLPTFIGRLVQDYYTVDGQPLGEKNPKWLQDDYVKFIRWGQWRIERTGAGILAFITNHGYLDNPTFRGMRQSLMNLFTEIYLVNLHGNSKKKETCPHGSPDENVFDIQQGVTLGIFLKEPNSPGTARVQHADLWGTREAKYEYLFGNDVRSTKWTKLVPKSPGYLFVPQHTGLLAEYEKGRSIAEAMPLNAIGLNSHRDEFAISFDRGTLNRRLDDLLSTRLTDEDLETSYGLEDTSDFNLERARQSLRAEKHPHSLVVPCLYRPFDERFLLYSSEVLDRPRPELNSHFVGHSNVGLATTRQTREAFGILCMDKVCGQHKIVAAYDGSSIFPLYLYSPDRQRQHGQAELSVHVSPWPPGNGGRRPNLSPAFVSDIQVRFGLSFISDGKGDLKTTLGPEDVFSYIYAIFHSPTYRSRYAEFLKSDFPRVPLTSDANLFCALCAKGAELVALHLLESPTLEKPIARYPVKGSNLVDKGFPKYVVPGEPEPGTGNPLKAGRVYINKEQHFEGVPPEVWNFHIGGYQVCEKWLKDRRGRTLTYDDQMHYCKVVAALSETIRLMREIDDLIPGWPLP
jgi:predicted helicase